ncbi:MAG TPA: LamG-like jellyroll fold domain-containing protein [Acidobacteriaceae bacterium]|nr:LamG-like jellyroll fold domain-containing protein [Acidobacteriaceae bacterium]
MPDGPIRHIFVVIAFISLGVSAQIPAARTNDNGVAAKALEIVSGIHGEWSQMPGNIVSTRMNGGALIGNGSVGVAIGGSADKQEYYVGRNDFWSVQRGKIMPLGRLELTIPALQNASAQMQENIGPADVTASFKAASAQLKSHSWVDANKNFFYIELENPGTTSVDMAAQMLDGFNHDDRDTLGGRSGQVYWRRVSPEVVHATIGGSNDGKNTGALDATVRSLEIFADSHPSASAKPVYNWRPETTLWDGSAKPAQPFSCGDIILPEKKFSVRGSIRMEHPNPDGIVFSSVTQNWKMQQQDPGNPLGNVRGHDSGRPQGAEAGLLIYLSQGRLAANLNGTVVTAAATLPLHQWTDIVVTYDGMKMALLVNGKTVGETTNFPSAAQVMGPEWEWAAAHPGDPRIPFDGIAPEGIFAVRILGVDASSENGLLRFQVPAGGKVIVAVAAVDDRDSAGYFQSSISELNRAAAQSVAAAWSRHVAWWRDFWSKSFIEIPDKTVQSWWYGSLYVLASCSRTGNVAPGLWGNWITSTNVGWQGDYTLDYNYQAPFWAAFPTNHVSLADSYDAPILAWLNRGRGLANHIGAHGVVYYTHLAPSPGWSADNFRALDQKSDALFAAVNCIQRWRYTRDEAYARKVWPFLTAVADFWDHDLKLVDGRYVDENDAEDEHLWGPADDTNPATVIGFLNMLYPALLDMGAQLHMGENMRATWQDHLTHLSPLPMAPAASVDAITKAVGKPIPDDRMVILESEHGMQWVNISRGDRFSDDPPVAIQGSSAGMNSLQTVFPAWNIGLESSPELRHAAFNTVDYTRLWYDSNNTSNFYPAAADAGYDPDSILKHLNLMVTHIGYPNFAYKFGAGGVENEATVPTTVAAMLLQSYQKNIHVFPNWPINQDASFGNLLAVGDFLVSSSIRNGKVETVKIRSQLGGTCNLANPWGAPQPVKLQTDGGPTRVMHGDVITIGTRPGEKLTFTPALN